MEFFEKLLSGNAATGEALTAIGEQLMRIGDALERIAESRESAPFGREGTDDKEKTPRTRATKAELEAKRAMVNDVLFAAGVSVQSLEKKWNKYIINWDMRLCDKALAIAADAAAKADAEAAQAADEAAVEAEATAAGGGRVAVETKAAKPSLPEAEKLADAYVRTYDDHVHGAAELSAAIKSKYGVDHLDGFTETGLQGVIGFIRGLLSAKAGDPAKAVAAAAEAPKAAAEMTPDEIKALRERVRAACAEHAKGEGGPEATKKLLREVGGKPSLLEVEPANLLEMLAVLTGQKAA